MSDTAHDLSVADRPSPVLSRDFWTPGRVTQLKTLHAKGLTFYDIADRLGATKNACVVKANRIGLKRHTQRLPRPPKTLAELKPETLTKLIDLGPRDCRFPYGEVGEPDFGFCGAKCIPGESWCPSHRSIVWRRPSEQEAA